MLEFLLGLGFIIIGVFVLVLGSAHFFFPILLDFENAIPKTGTPLKPFKLGFIRYPTQRSEVHGIAWVMNHAASYTLVTLGLLDIFWWQWLREDWGQLLALWMVGWWLIRAGSQVYLGKRRGDGWIALGFTWMAFWHLLGVFLL